MKEDMIDIFKIDKGKLGIININNMIPTPDICLKEAIPMVQDFHYKKLLEKQITFINNHKKELFKKIDLFTTLYLEGNLQKIEYRCCDFDLLEKKCLEYLEQLIEV